jgi:peptidase inhibitor I9
MEYSMKMRIAILIVAILLALAVITPVASAQDDDNGAATATPSSTGTATLAPGPTPAQGAIPGRYIVVLEEEARDPTAVAREHAQRHGAKVLHTYQHALDGYAARIPDRRLDEVLAEERVDYVERDATVTTAAQTRPWGIDKVDADISSTRAGNGAGAVSNVNAYIIDTGIDKNHADLNVAGHVDFSRGQNTDRNGHGACSVRDLPGRGPLRVARHHVRAQVCGIPRPRLERVVSLGRPRVNQAQQAPRSPQKVIPRKPVLFDAEPPCGGRPHVRETLPDAEVRGHSSADREERDALAGVVRTRVGRVVAVVGGDNENVSVR